MTLHPARPHKPTMSSSSNLDLIFSAKQKGRPNRSGLSY
jgi:hypothetical protein